MAISYTTLLFDLDGTLLPMDQKRFARAYLDLFDEHCRTLRYPQGKSLQALQAGLLAMMTNDGTQTNKARFKQAFSQVSGLDSETFNERFASFYDYDEEFLQLQRYTQREPAVRSAIEEVRRKGYRVVLATNPVFPYQATFQRLRWAGLDAELFSLVTTYEDFSYTKPHPAYYRQICTALSLSGEECLMIGNDVSEDMVARKVVMEVFLTDCLINERRLPLESYNQGTLKDLLSLLERLLTY